MEEILKSLLEKKIKGFTKGLKMRDFDGNQRS